MKNQSSISTPRATVNLLQLPHFLPVQNMLRAGGQQKEARAALEDGVHREVLQRERAATVIIDQIR